MKRVSLDLNQGLNLSASELALPFVITYLPFWPKPGLGWASHPGHDILETPLSIGEATEIIASSPSGMIALRGDGRIAVYDLPSGRQASGSASNGVLIPKVGWYRSRFNRIFVEEAAGAAEINLRPLKVIAGNLQPGRYVIWALGFIRLEGGLFFHWYSTSSVSLSNAGGIEIELSEAPGDSRIVKLYVQRAMPGNPLSPLTYLSDLTGTDKSFVYTSHTQEGEQVNLAVPRGQGTFAAYYGGRYFYQSDELTVLGKAGTPTRGGDPVASTGEGGYASLEADGLGLGSAAQGSSPVVLGAFAQWDTFVQTSAGSFVAVRRGGQTEIYHASDPYLLGWSLVYRDTSGAAYTLSAASPSYVVFMAPGKALVGLLDGGAYQGPSGWREVVLPSANQPKDLIWTGTEFAAVVDRGLLRGGPTAASWTLITPPANLDPSFTEWRHLAYGAGRFFIYAAQPLGGGDWYHRIFSYDGANWRSDYNVPLGFGGMVHQRFSYLHCIGNTLIVGHGLKEGIYWNGPVLGAIDNIDYYAVYNASQFPGGFSKDVFQAVPAASSYGKAYRTSGQTALFVSGNSLRWMDFSRSGNALRFLAYTDSNKGVGVYGEGIALNKGQMSVKLTTYSTSTNGTSSITHSANLAEFSEEGGLYYCRDYIYLTGEDLKTRSIRVSAGGSEVKSLLREGGKVFVATGTTLLGGAPEALSALANVGNLRLQRASGNEVLAFAQSGNTLYRYAGGSLTNYNLPSAPIAAVQDGTNWFVVCAGHVVKVETNGISTVATGTFTGGSDGSGAIYLGVVEGGANKLKKLDTGDNTLSDVGTLPNGDRLRGILLSGVGPQVLMAAGKTVLLLDGSNLFTVYNAPNAVHLIGKSGGQGGGEGEGGNLASTVKLPPNTVIWTEPGYINLCNPFSYHSFVWRASREITEIVPSPSGVLVFADNEVYVMSGRFTSVGDTRIAPYPTPIGLDKGAKLGSAGSTFFVVWGGRLYAMSGDGTQLISAQVDNGDPFVAVLYDAKSNTLVARKASGRVLRYETTRRVWFDDMMNASDIAHYIEGIVYLRNTTSGRRLYALASEGQALSALYYRPPQEIWIDAVKLEGEVVKRLRALHILAKAEGPLNARVQVFNENEIEVANAPLLLNIAGNMIGLGRYRATFPPVVAYAVQRIRIAFAGARFLLAPQVEVHYEARERGV